MDEHVVTIEFKGRHDHISERMKEHATHKIGRLANYRERLTRIEVVADHVHDNPEVELIVHLTRGAPIVSRERSTSFSATIDVLVDKVDALLRKQKEKALDRQKHRGEARDGGIDDGRDGGDEETYEEAVKKSL